MSFATAKWGLQKSYKKARWQLLKVNKEIGDNFEQPKMTIIDVFNLIECCKKITKKL
jgi:hypothetical protein